MGGDLSQQPAFRNEKNVIIKGSLKNTINIFENSFFIGCHPNITEVQQQKVVDVINRFMSSFDI
jgi:dTDP-4-amino-4,6-dideoxygalactose transaminase